ncbi:hypothetical protein NE237_009272 [Protea cynaroides]|uniref:RRM domain-containing protein n=1 Tax=Protea cynaroides TaxID=273540 RepID=A0A9Q0R0G9_9MAGN|nr:hypothetical protein NE237_009272 [Protea cynaroides]
MMSYSRRSRSSHSRSPYRRDGKSVSRSLSGSRSRSRSRSHDSTDVENPGNNLYVTGLSPRITKKELEKHFSTEGEVTDIHLVADPWTRESRGFAFVTMATVGDANRCIKYLNRSVLEGRVITVEKARRRRGRTPTPGKYLGVRTIRVRRRSPSYSPGRRSRYGSLSSERDRERSYSPCYTRRRYRSRSCSPYSRSPVGRRDRSYSPYYSRSYDRRRRSYSPDDHRSYLRDRSVSPYYRRRYNRSVSRSVSPRPRRSSRRGYSRSVSPRPRWRSSRRSYSHSVSPRPRWRSSRRSYSRSVSPRPRSSKRSYSRSVSPVPAPRRRLRRSISRSASPKRSYSGRSYSRSCSVSSKSRSRSVSRSRSPTPRSRSPSS